MADVVDELMDRNKLRVNAAAVGSGVDVDERTQLACDEAKRVAWTIGLDAETRAQVERALDDRRATAAAEGAPPARPLGRRKGAPPVRFVPKPRGGVVTKVLASGAVLDAASDALIHLERRRRDQHQAYRMGGCLAGRGTGEKENLQPTGGPVSHGDGSHARRGALGSCCNRPRGDQDHPRARRRAGLMEPWQERLQQL